MSSLKVFMSFLTKIQPIWFQSEQIFIHFDLIQPFGQPYKHINERKALLYRLQLN